MKRLKRMVCLGLAISFLASIPGPRVFAAMVQVRTAGTAVPVPGIGLGMLPGARTAGARQGPASAAALNAPSGLATLSPLPALQPTGSRTQAQGIARAHAQAKAPAASAKTGADSKKKSLPRRILDRLLGRKTAQPGPKAPDYEQMRIDRVNAIALVLEKLEAGEDVPDELLHRTAAGFWDRAARDAARGNTADFEAEQARLQAQAADAAADAETKEEVSKQAPVKLQPAQAEKANPTRAPPRRGSLIKIPAPVAGAAAKAKAGIGSVLNALPAPVFIGVIAAAAFGLDLAARALLPQYFGFSPVAGLWVSIGMGAIITPALLYTRFEISRHQSAALKPLQRYTDLLFGAIAGAALSTGVGIWSLLDSGVRIADLLSRASLPGTLSLAPALGLWALMAAMPVLYGAGHIAYGLRTGRIVSVSLPLNFVFKVVLINMLFGPGQYFISLSGGLPWILPMVVMWISILGFFNSGKRMAAMTVANASPQERERELRYARNPGLRGLLDPVPHFDKDWLIRPEGNKEDPARRLRRTKLQSAFWLSSIALSALGLVALHQMSITGALAYAGPLLLHSVKFMLPMFLFSGFVAVLFFRAKRVHDGPIYEMVRELAGKLKLPMPRVYEGAKTGSPNAFASGALHRLSVVAVVGSITRMLTMRELRGVIGHELSHVKYRHMLAFFAAIPFLQLLSLGAASLPQLIVSYWATLVWVLLFLANSRTDEQMADSGSAVLVQDPKALATGLRKLSIFGRLMSKVPHSEGSWLYKLLLSHPSPKDRVRYLGGMSRRVHSENTGK